MPPPRIRRSRVIWDEARASGGLALARAILYELQPIRFRHVDVSGVVSAARSAARVGWGLLRALPGLVRGIYRILKSLTLRQWSFVAAAVAYYYIVRSIHRALEAGPLVVIVTALVGIFTIGLGDEGGDGLSAYSVFNRGFERLMGSVDVESLVQQYAGGAMAMHAQGVPRHDIEEDNFQRRNQHNARRGNRNNENAAAPAAAANADNNAIDNDGDDNNDGRNRARRSNKKNRRRRDVEARREQQREIESQRQAAAEMGFVGNGNEQDVVAMNRLVEDQIAVAEEDDNSIDAEWEEVNAEE